MPLDLLEQELVDWRRPQPHSRLTFPNSMGMAQLLAKSPASLQLQKLSRLLQLDLSCPIFILLLLVLAHCLLCTVWSGRRRCPCWGAPALVPSPSLCLGGKSIAPAAARAPAWIVPPGAIGFSRKLPLLDAIDLGSPTVPVSRHQRLLETLSWRQKIYGKAGGLMKYSWEFLSSVFTHCKKAVFIFSELWIVQ